MWGFWFRRGRSDRSLIGDGMVVRGPIQSRGEVEIQGRVDGDIDHVGRLVIGGEVYGNVRVSDQLELLPTARLFGDVMCMRLVVHSGALFQGSTRMPDGPDLLPEPPAAPPVALPATAAAAPPQDSPLAILFQPIAGEERHSLISSAGAAATAEAPLAAASEPAPVTPGESPAPPASQERKAVEAPAFYGGFQPAPVQK